MVVMRIPKLPVVPLPGSGDWSEAYEYAEVLERRFPGQDASDLCVGAKYNDYGPLADHQVDDLVCNEFGQRDGPGWKWTVTFVNGETWIATGGCDYTGWDCQSFLRWVRA
jgi:hypothetical protein